MSELKQAVSGWAQAPAETARWLTVLGVVTAITGFIAVGSPLGAGIGVSLMVGIAMVIGGGARILAAFSAGSFGQGTLAFLGGILALVAGVICLARPGLALETMTLMLGVYLLMDGVSAAVLAFHVRPHDGWGWMLCSAALSVVLGFMLLREWPLSGMWAVGTLVGINLVFSGASMLSIASSLRGMAKRVA